MEINAHNLYVASSITEQVDCRLHPSICLKLNFSMKLSTVFSSYRGPARLPHGPYQIYSAFIGHPKSCFHCNYAFILKKVATCQQSWWVVYSSLNPCIDIWSVSTISVPRPKTFPATMSSINPNASVIVLYPRSKKSVFLAKAETPHIWTASKKIAWWN